MHKSRNILAIVGLLGVGAALFVGAFWIADLACRRQMARPTDDLGWLRMEFKLNDHDLRRIRQLHEGYLPKCQHWCSLIADRKRELQTELTTASRTTSTATNLLNQIAVLRANCQADMLRHFEEVSRVMPPEQGRRYLAEMRRLTLGFHELIEASMDPSSSPHGHH